MKLRIYTLWEGADESNLKYLDVEVLGNYLQHEHIPNVSDPDDFYYESVRRFFKYTKDKTFKSMFPSIKPNYSVEIFHSTVFNEANDESFLDGHKGYIHLNFLQRNYLDWNFGIHWAQYPSRWFGSVVRVALKVGKFFA